MFSHGEICDILETSLKELILASYRCIEFRKDNKNWFNADKGCLGYPAAILLFAVADTIGSAFDGVVTFKIPIGREKKPISANNFEHFYILNSPFYKLHLDETIIQEIYYSYRCLLVHNSSLLKGYFLDIGKVDDIPIEVTADMTGNSYPFRVNLRAFHKLSSNAVDKFLSYARAHAEQIRKGQLVEKLNEKCRLPTDSVSQAVTTSGSTLSITTFRDNAGDHKSKGKKKYFVDFEFRTPPGNYYWFPLFVHSTGIEEAVRITNAIKKALQEHYEVRSKSEPRLYIEGMTSDLFDKYVKQRVSGKLSVLDADVWRFRDVASDVEISFSAALELVQSNEKNFNENIIAKTIERHRFPVRLIQEDHLVEFKEFLLINIVVR